MADRPSRRAVLLGAAAALPVLTTACRGIQVLGAPPPPAPDIRMLASAIAAEKLMAARYAAAISLARAAGTDGAAAAAALALIRTEHEQHLAQLSSRLIEPSQSATAGARRTAPPASLAAAIAALAADEQAAANRFASQLLAVPPSTAQLFASIGASEATHVPVLLALGRSR